MIVNLKKKLSVNPLGSIKTGIKAKNSAGKEYPKAVDYFVIDKFPELIKSYGEKPNKLVIFFPSNDPADFMDINFTQYGSNNQLKRRCNGETCFHRIEETIDGKTWQAGTFTDCICYKANEETGERINLIEDSKQRCKTSWWMKAYIADKQSGDVISPSCYLFKSGSQNSFENLLSEIDRIRRITNGNLNLIPFGLSVSMVAGSTDAKTKFPIWKLVVLGKTIQEIKGYEFQKSMNFKSHLMLSQNLPDATIIEQQEDELPEDYEPEEKAFDPDNPLGID